MPNLNVTSKFDASVLHHRPFDAINHGICGPVGQRRSHPEAILRRIRKLHGARSEIPITSPNCGRSRCHPIPALGLYSMSKACSRAAANPCGMRGLLAEWPREMPAARQPASGRRH